MINYFKRLKEFNDGYVPAILYFPVMFIASLLISGLFRENYVIMLMIASTILYLLPPIK